MSKFLPPMPLSHSDNLSSFSTDLVNDIVCKTSLSLVPMNSFLNGLFGGHRKKSFVQLIGTIMVICWCGTVELLIVPGGGMVDETVAIGFGWVIIQ